jgi:lysophospholipase L1-like esterase
MVILLAVVTAADFADWKTNVNFFSGRLAERGSQSPAPAELSLAARARFHILCAMKSQLRFAATLAFSLAVITSTLAQTNLPATNAVAAEPPAPQMNTATNPVPRDPKWVTRHESFLRDASNAAPVELVFLGDSITDGWRNRGSNIWNQIYAPRRPLNLGISGDRTEHVLWRIAQGELDGLHPKALVLMIGTNNSGKEKNGQPRNTVPQIVEGVQAVVAAVRAKLPATKILLLGVFPRGTFDNEQRAQVALVNTVIAKLDDGKSVKYLDIGSQFLTADGTLPKAIMPDLLHPNERGYQIWADAMEPTLAQLLQ